jgi:hypothetical protein
MRTRRSPQRVLVALLVALRVVAAVPAAPEDLEQAKKLYREGHFSESITSLRLVVATLGQSQDLGLRRIQLADAYLHLALSHVALGDMENGKQALKEMLRIDAGRRLDPEVYAPKVVALFDQAQSEIAAEPRASVAPSQAPASAGVSKKPEGKKSLKLPLLLGAGAAGAAGLAVGLHGGGGGSTAPQTIVATDVVTPARIAWLSSIPAPGTTVPLRLTSCPRNRNGSCTNGLTLSFEVTSTTRVPRAFLHVELLSGGVECLFGYSIDDQGIIELVPGKPTAMVTRYLALEPACQPPFKTTSLSATLITEGAAQTLVAQGFAGGFDFVP